MHQDNSMRHFAVMDLGGTKAEAILFREDGQILSRIVRPGGTPFEDGPEKARSNAISVIRELLSMHAVPISALYCRPCGLDLGSPQKTGWRLHTGIKRRYFPQLP